MSHKILFVGAGAVGSYLASFFARAGHDVTVIDSWPEQVETIRQRGVAVTGPHEPFTARLQTLHVHEAQQLAADFDIGIVAMKSYDTAWAAHLLVPHVKPSGFVICAQNCWNDPLVASIAGPERTVGLIMSGISVAMWKPGEVERGAERGSGHVVFRAGSPDGTSTPHLQAVADLLSVVDASQTTDNLWGERWGKLCINAMGNPVQAMTGLGGRDIAAEPRGREITIRLGSESARVGLALGHRVVKFGAATAEQWAEAGRNTDTYRGIDTALVPKVGSRRNWRSSMAQDVVKGRRTEIEFMNGFVVAQGKGVGVETPVSGAVVEIVHEIDAKRRKPSPDHIEDALQKAGY